MVYNVYCHYSLITSEVLSDGAIHHFTDRQHTNLVMPRTDIDHNWHRGKQFKWHAVINLLSVNPGSDMG